MKLLFTKGKKLRQPKVRVKKLQFFTFCPNEGENFFLCKIESRFVFCNLFRGFLHFLFYFLNFELPIPGRAMGGGPNSISREIYIG